MWQAIRQGAPAAALGVQSVSIGKRSLRFVAACAGIAAVLTVALLLGQQNYDTTPAVVAHSPPPRARMGVGKLDRAPAAQTATALLRSPTKEPAEPTISEEDVERLSAIGYVGGAAHDVERSDKVAYGYEVLSGGGGDGSASGAPRDAVVAADALEGGYKDVYSDADGARWSFRVESSTGTLTEAPAAPSIPQSADGRTADDFQLHYASLGSEWTENTAFHFAWPDGEDAAASKTGGAGGDDRTGKRRPRRTGFDAAEEADRALVESDPRILGLSKEVSALKGDLDQMILSPDSKHSEIEERSNQLKAAQRLLEEERERKLHEVDEYSNTQVRTAFLDSASQPPRTEGETGVEPEDDVRDQPGAEAAQPPAREAPPVRVKIIKTGELALEVPAYEAAADRVEGIVAGAGGFVADVQVEELPGGALRGRIVVRVPPERFEGLFAAIKEIGKVESENVKAADVTAQYVDLEARIRGLQITEERLQELIQSKSFIDKVESLLEVEREMTRVRSQIEQLQGELRVMADRVALSTITVVLHEPQRTVPAASMSVEVPVVAEAAETLGEALAALGGRLGSGKTAKRADGTIRGDYQLFVSLARFGELLGAIEGLGRIDERQISDRQFTDAGQPWAEKVECMVALVLYERSPQPPRANMMVEVDSVEAVRVKLNEALVPCQAAVMSSATTRRDDGSSASELRVRVPAGRFAELVDSLTGLGRVLAKETAGEAGRIVGGAASLPCDIALALTEPARQVPSGSMTVEVEAFEAARHGLTALVAERGVQVLASASTQRTDGTWAGRFRLGIKSADMDAVVERLESFGRVASRQITGTGLGELSRAAPDALGVIELDLQEPAAISPEPERGGASIRGRVRDGLAGFYNSLGLIAFGLMAMAPWLIIVVGLAWAGLWGYRRMRRVPVRGTKAESVGD